MTIGLRSLLLACVALLAVVSTSRAQMISVVPRFVEGERIRLLVETSRKDQRVDQSSRTPVTVTVLSASDDGAVLIWEAGETEIDHAPQETIALLRSMSSVLEGLRLECEFNAAGEFTGLRNEAEVLDKMKLAIERLTETMLAQIPDQQMHERVRLGLSQLMQPEIILASTTKNVGLYAGAAQIEVDLGESISIETELETALGSVQSVLTVSARDFEKDKNAAVIEVVSEPTPESVGAITIALVRRMLQTDEAEKVEEAMKGFSLEMRDQTTYEMDLSRGWPTTVDFLRLLNVQNSERIDRTRITLQSVVTP